MILYENSYLCTQCDQPGAVTAQPPTNINSQFISGFLLGQLNTLSLLLNFGSSTANTTQLPDLESTIAQPLRNFREMIFQFHRNFEKHQDKIKFFKTGFDFCVYSNFLKYILPENIEDDKTPLDFNQMEIMISIVGNLPYDLSQATTSELPHNLMISEINRSHIVCASVSDEDQHQNILYIAIVRASKYYPNIQFDDADGLMIIILDEFSISERAYWIREDFLVGFLNIVLTNLKSTYSENQSLTFRFRAVRKQKCPRKEP